jgi:hypothetical protein
MKNIFHVQLLSFSNLTEIEGAWTPADYSRLLETMEFGDLSEVDGDDLREMCIMSLQDLEPVEAAFLILKQVAGDALRDGQIRNMANEMLDEKLWEEYVTPSFHERLFNVASLLFAAFPRIFPKPDAVRICLEIKPENEAAKQQMSASLHESFLIRLLADGMDNHSVVHRMYHEQLEGKSFPDADQLVWTARPESITDDTMRLEIISSGYWLDALEETRSYDSNAYADATP